MTWPSHPKTEWVCNNAYCRDYLTGEWGYHDTCCRGHYEDDQFFDYANANRTAFVGSTNKQVMSATDPTSEDYSMTYIYDGFTWDHCIDVDVDIVAYLDQFYQNTTTA